MVTAPETIRMTPLYDLTIRLCFRERMNPQSEIASVIASGAKITHRDLE